MDRVEQLTKYLNCNYNKFQMTYYPNKFYNRGLAARYRAAERELQALADQAMVRLRENDPKLN